MKDKNFVRHSLQFVLFFVFIVFTLYYTWYISAHYGDFGSQKGDDLFYYAEFLLIDGYCFFILYWIIKRGRYPLLILLLPFAAIVAAVFIAIIVTGILGDMGEKDSLSVITPVYLLMILLTVRMINPLITRKQ